jgi:hypothetical protein
MDEVRDDKIMCPCSFVYKQIQKKTTGLRPVPRKPFVLIFCAEVTDALGGKNLNRNKPNGLIRYS